MELLNIHRTTLYATVPISAINFWQSSSKYFSNRRSFPEYEHQRFSIPFPIRDIFLCFFFTYSLISFSDNRRRELNLPFLGHTQVSRSHSLKVLAPARAFYKIRFSFSFLFNILFHFYERKARGGALVCAHDTRTTFQHYKLLLIFASKWM